MTESSTQQLRKNITAKRIYNEVIPAKDLLSTGSTLLNLALSGKSGGGFAKKKYYLCVGDSESGKTFLALTCMAELCKNKNFADYKIIYDNGEDGALMSWSEYFGKAAADRIEPPAWTADGEPIYSETVEQFYYFASDYFSKGPCLYVLDSENNLDSEAELKKFGKKKLAAMKGSGKEFAGEYGMDKPKYHSRNIRKLTNKMKKHGGILVIVSQTRDNTNPMSYDKRTRSGGRGLKFWATGEFWLSVAKTLTKTVADHPMQYGVVSQIDLRKNRQQGKKRRVYVPIIHDYGIDDIDSMITWLVDWTNWKETNGVLTAPEFDFKGRRSKLVRLIESEDRERELRALVASRWNEIEEKLRPKGRKKRYE